MSNSLETQASNAVGKAGDVIQQLARRYEEQVRQAPLPAVAVAVGAGYFLKSGLLAVLVGALLRIAAALVRPALVIFAGVKLYDFLSHRGENPEPESSLVTVGPSAAPGTMEPAVIPSSNL